MDTDQLIKKLVSEGPRKSLPHPMKQTAYWLTGTVLFLVAVSIFSGLRADIMDKIIEPLYLMELGLVLTMGISTALAAFCLSRPDAHQKEWIKYTPFAAALLWAGVAFWDSIGTFGWDGIFYSMELGQFDCPTHILMYSLPPGIAIFMIVRKGAPIQCCWAGAMATWSVTSFGYLCMRLIEMNDDPVHLLVWHALPIMLMCVIGMILGKFSFRW